MFFLLASAANACGKGGECTEYVEKCCADIVWKTLFPNHPPSGLIYTLTPPYADHGTADNWTEKQVHPH